jgi:hypothetical protein
MAFFLAQAAVSTEQAAKALADQTYNQPVNWWLVFFLGLVTTGAIIMVVRSFRKSDAMEKMLKQANDDRVATAEGVVARELREIKEIVIWIKERLIGRGDR